MFMREAVQMVKECSPTWWVLMYCNRMLYAYIYCINMRNYYACSMHMHVHPYWKSCAFNMHVIHNLHAYVTVTLMLHACTMSVYMTCMLQ